MKVNYMQTSTLRKLFLDFFTKRGHKLVASSSVVSPSDDPTVMWTSAGMSQFKDVFLGKEKRDYTRAVTSQKCLRAGGKHNDLDQVGFTSCHHTFFEMLGNFSFGDYSKVEAIHYAWEFVTGPKSQGNLGLDPSRIWITVFEGADGIPPDTEAETEWIKAGVPKERIMRFGKKDNFWQMGDTGPCGPCSEIHYDRGSQYLGDTTPNGTGNRVIEIWNLVFMHYDREANGNMKLLPKPSIDTGMGLERVASILQEVDSNYEIDLFSPIFDAIWEKAKIDPIDRNKNINLIASRVIADHIRAATFMIFDGVVPSNEGRGYVLRKIIRRALRFSRKLGINNNFFADLCPSVSVAMGDAYPELNVEQNRTMEVLAREENQFIHTLDVGLKQLEAIDTTSGTISGMDVFKLYDTFGVPLDLIEDWCQEHQLKYDLEAFKIELAKQKSKSRSTMKIHDIRLSGDLAILVDYPATDFIGYEATQAQSKVVALFDQNQKQVKELYGSGFLLLEQTPFYAQSGGQIGDIGIIKVENLTIQVTDCTMPVPKRHLHHIDVTGNRSLREREVIFASIDIERRTRIRAHHTATHLIHAALRKILGNHVKQAGSIVNAEKLRLDFNHFTNVTLEQILEIERLVNQKTLGAIQVSNQQMPIKEAVANGAMALFGEKYGDIVRVISVPGFSSELCGGTHVSNTGEIGLIKIISEGAVAAGVRRLEAVAGIVTMERLQEDEHILTLLSQQASLPKQSLNDFIINKDKYIQQLEKELKQVRLKTASNYNANENIELVGNVTLVTSFLDGVDSKTMREIMDQHRTRHRNAIVVITSKIAHDKLNILISVASNLTNNFDATILFKVMAPHINGKGGGKKDLVQGGGTMPANLSSALAALRIALGN